MPARAALAFALALVLAAGGTPPAPPDGTAAARTGKERLSAKWADDQRVDDCKVPPARRDPNRPRPDCAGKTPPGDR